MKFHWGHGIALFYSLFVLTLIVVVVRTTYFDNSLVRKDYYAQDIVFQQVIDKKRNSKRLQNPVSLDKKAGKYVLQFPIEEVDNRIDGSIQIYCPSSAKHDLFVPIKLDTTGSQQLSLEQLKAGKYKLIVNWSNRKREYLDEFVIQHKG